MSVFKRNNPGGCGCDCGWSSSSSMTGTILWTTPAGCATCPTRIDNVSAGDGSYSLLAYSLCGWGTTFGFTPTYDPTTGTFVSPEFLTQTYHSDYYDAYGNLIGSADFEQRTTIRVQCTACRSVLSYENAVWRDITAGFTSIPRGWQYQYSLTGSGPVPLASGPPPQAAGDFTGPFDGFCNPSRIHVLSSLDW